MKALISVFLLLFSLTSHAALNMKIQYAQGGFVNKIYPHIRFITLATRIPSSGTWQISVMGVNAANGNEGCWINITSDDRNEIFQVYETLRNAKFGPGTTLLYITKNTAEVSGPACNHTVDLRKDALTLQVVDI